MHRALILNTSTVVYQDIQALRVGYSSHACFIKDMGMLWRNDVIAQLVDEHPDRLSLIKPINDTDVLGCYASSLFPPLRRTVCPSRLTAARRWM